KRTLENTKSPRRRTMPFLNSFPLILHAPRSKPPTKTPRRIFELSSRLHANFFLFRRLVDLVESPAVGKMCLLGGPPTPEEAVNGKQVNFGKLAGELIGDGFLPGPEKMSGGNLLPLFRVEIFQISLGRRPGSPSVYDFINQGRGRLG